MNVAFRESILENLQYNLLAGEWRSWIDWIFASKSTSHVSTNKNHRLEGNSIDSNGSILQTEQKIYYFITYDSFSVTKRDRIPYRISVNIFFHQFHPFICLCMHDEDDVRACARTRLPSTAEYVCRMEFSLYERKAACVGWCTQRTSDTIVAVVARLYYALSRIKSEARELIIGLENKIGGNLASLYHSSHSTKPPTNFVCACVFCRLLHATIVYATRKRYFFCVFALDWLPRAHDIRTLFTACIRADMIGEWHVLCVLVESR